MILYSVAIHMYEYQIKNRTIHLQMNEWCGRVARTTLFAADTMRYHMQKAAEQGPCAETFIDELIFESFFLASFLTWSLSFFLSHDASFNLSFDTAQWL